MTLLRLPDPDLSRVREERARRLQNEIVAAMCASPLFRRRPDTKEELEQLAADIGVTPKTVERAFKRNERAHQRNRDHEKVTTAVYLAEHLRDAFDQLMSSRSWSASGFIRSLVHFYLLSQSEPPAAIATTMGGGKKREKDPNAKWKYINVPMPRALRQALSMRARARGLTISCVMRSLVVGAMTGSWPLPPRIVGLRECHPRAENYYLPATVAVGSYVSEEE